MYNIQNVIIYRHYDNGPTHNTNTLKQKPSS
jgi:hypothetical protein